MSTSKPNQSKIKQIESKIKQTESKITSTKTFYHKGNDSVGRDDPYDINDYYDEHPNYPQ
jgi:hypothetical protein